MEEEIVCNRWKDLAGDQMCRLSAVSTRYDILFSNLLYESGATNKRTDSVTHAPDSHTTGSYFS